MGTTRVARVIRATRADVYRALLDAEAIAQWRVPDGMRAVVDELDAREGGTFRVSLTYVAGMDDEGDGSLAAGKTSEHTDTYHGHFAELVTDQRVVEVIEFESDDPALQGRMRMTSTLTDVDGGTEVVVLHEGLPAVVAEAENEEGTRMALANLARLVEQRAGGC